MNGRKLFKTVTVAVAATGAMYYVGKKMGVPLDGYIAVVVVGTVVSIVVSIPLELALPEPKAAE